MGVYIPGMEMPKGGEHPLWIALHSDGTVEYNANKGYGWQMTTAIPVPPHGRLIDESAIELSKYEKAAHDALHNGKGSILYDSGVLAGARDITRLVRNAPTIIPADPAEED